MKERKEKEQTPFIKKVVDRLTGLLPHRREQKSGEEVAYQLAYEAVDLFVHAEFQISLTPYHAGDKAYFDVSAQEGNPPTIIMLTLDSNPLSKNDPNKKRFDIGYRFFVIASDTEGRKYIWEAIVPGATRYHVAALRIRDRFVLDPCHMPSSPILIEQALPSFIGAVDGADKVTTTCIDVMTGGLAEKSKKPVASQTARQTDQDYYGAPVPNGTI